MSSYTAAPAARTAIVAAVDTLTASGSDKALLPAFGLLAREAADLLRFDWDFSAASVLARVEKAEGYLAGAAAMTSNLDVKGMLAEVAETLEGLHDEASRATETASAYSRYSTYSRGGMVSSQWDMVDY